jgi:hypothetical protein
MTPPATPLSCSSRHAPDPAPPSDRCWRMRLSWRLRRPTGRRAGGTSRSGAALSGRGRCPCGPGRSPRPGGVGVVVAGGDVEGELGAAAADAVAQRGRHGGLLPVARVGQHRRVAPGRPAAAHVRGQAERTLVQEDQTGSASLGICLIRGQSSLTPSGRSPPGRVRRRDAWAAAHSSPADGAAAPRCGRGDGARRSAARSPARRGPGSRALR